MLGCNSEGFLYDYGLHKMKNVLVNYSYIFVASVLTKNIHICFSYKSESYVAHHIRGMHLFIEDSVLKYGYQMAKYWILSLWFEILLHVTLLRIGVILLFVGVIATCTCSLKVYLEICNNLLKVYIYLYMSSLIGT